MGGFFFLFFWLSMGAHACCSFTDICLSYASINRIYVSCLSSTTLDHTEGALSGCHHLNFSPNGGLIAQSSQFVSQYTTSPLNAPSRFLNGKTRDKQRNIKWILKGTDYNMNPMIIVSVIAFGFNSAYKHIRILSRERSLRRDHLPVSTYLGLPHNGPPIYCS